MRRAGLRVAPLREHETRTLLWELVRRLPTAHLLPSCAPPHSWRVPNSVLPGQDPNSPFATAARRGAASASGMPWLAAVARLRLWLTVALSAVRVRCASRACVLPSQATTPSALEGCPRGGTIAWPTALTASVRRMATCVSLTPAPARMKLGPLCTSSSLTACARRPLSLRASPDPTFPWGHARRHSRA